MPIAASTAPCVMKLATPTTPHHLERVHEAAQRSEDVRWPNRS